MKTKFKTSGINKSIRMNYLYKYWEREVTNYSFDLAHSNNEEDQKLCKLFDKRYEKLSKIFLHLFMRQCRIRHSLVFF
jgi:hypothetical protein